MFRGALALLGACGGAAAHAYYSAAARAAEGVISPDEFRPFTLLSSNYETHDTRRFHFSTGDAAKSLDLPIASCIVCKFTDKDGKNVIRPYTPISTADKKGSFEIMIKKYPKSKMGTHVFQMKTGETLDMKGPFVKFNYKPNEYTHVAMIAGGTGIAPMYQVIRGILDNPNDKTHISLIFANNSRKDILLAQELSELSRIYKNFNVYHTLLDVPRGWLGGVGYISEPVLANFLPKPGERRTKILVCGPPPMMTAISGDKDYSAKGAPAQGPLSGLLAKMGYKEDQVYKF